MPPGHTDIYFSSSCGTEGEYLKHFLYVHFDCLLNKKYKQEEFLFFLSEILEINQVRAILLNTNLCCLEKEKIIFCPPC